MVATKTDEAGTAGRGERARRAGKRSAKRDGQPERVFSTSVLISGTRCTLTYVIFPFIAPIIGIASGVGSGIGLVIGLLAIVSNVFSIRRFWRADHKWKWPVSVLNAGIIVLLVILMIVDAEHLFS